MSEFVKALKDDAAILRVAAMVRIQNMVLLEGVGEHHSGWNGRTCRASDGLPALQDSVMWLYSPQALLDWQPRYLPAVA